MPELRLSEAMLFTTSGISLSTLRKSGTLGTLEGVAKVQMQPAYWCVCCYAMVAAVVVSPSTAESGLLYG